MRNGNVRWALALAGVVVLVALVGVATGSLDVAGPGAGGEWSRTPSSERAAPGADGGAGPTATPRPSALLLFPSLPATQWEELAFAVEGFQPGETVVLLVEHEGTAKEIGRLEANGEGKIEDGKVILPSWLESGKRSATAVGGDSGTRAAATLYVRARNLWVNLSSYNPRLASKLGFIAGGFEPGDRVKVYLTLGGDANSLSSQEPLATMEADEAGNTSWTEAEIPPVEPGKYTLLLKGDRTEGELKESVTVEPLRPELELSPWSGPPGRKVDLNGNGFLPNEQVEVFLGAGTEPIGTFRADRYGGLWGAGPISIPLDSRGGRLPILLRGKTSGGEVARDFSVVAPSPWVELSSYAGFAGAAVVARGGGFAAGERVTLHVGSASSPAVATTVTNEDGHYVGLGPGVVPSDAVQEVTFVVVGESSGAQGEATFKVMEPFAPVPELPRTR